MILKKEKQMVREVRTDYGGAGGRFLDRDIAQNDFYKFQDVYTPMVDNSIFKHVLNPFTPKGEIFTKSAVKDKIKSTVKIPVDAEMVKSGTVKDENGNPLLGVNFKDLGDKYNGGMTDFTGNFYLTGKKNTTFEISYLGFKTKKYNFNKMPNEIVLVETTEQLDGVNLGTVGKKTNYLVWIVLAVIAFVTIKKS